MTQKYSEEYKIHYPPECWDGEKFIDLSIPGRKIIDSHVHCLFTEGMLHSPSFKSTYGFTPPFDGSIEEILRIMDHCNIDKSVIFHAGSGGTSKEAIDTNEKIAAICKNHRNLLGFGYVPSNSDKEVHKIIEKAVNVQELRGLGELFPENGAGDYEHVFEAANYFGLPVCIDRNRWEKSDSDWFLNNLNRFPGLKLIFAHMGHDNPEILQLGRIFPNVYYDVSFNIHFYEARVFQQIKFLGCDRIIFGTDFPATAWTMYDDILRVNRMPLSESEKDLIFFGNINNLLF
jgi:predicted TIM-barrel fold metal-dependent hydrolase